MRCTGIQILSMHAHKCMHSHTNMHAHMHAHTNTRMHVCVHTHARTHAYTPGFSFPQPAYFHMGEDAQFSSPPTSPQPVESLHEVVSDPVKTMPEIIQPVGRVYSEYLDGRTELEMKYLDVTQRQVGMLSQRSLRVYPCLPEIYIISCDTVFRDRLLQIG